MKILFVGRYSESDILTGPEKVAKKLFRSLQLLNGDTHFITYFFKDYKDSSFFKRLFGYSEIGENFKMKRMGIVRFLFYVLREKPGIIHLITFERFYIPLLILKQFFDVKIIYTIHGIYKYEKSIFLKKPSWLSDLKDLRLEKLLFKKSDSLVFLSSQMEKLGREFYKFNKEKISVIPNGVDINKASENKRIVFSSDLDIVFYNGLDSSRNRGLGKLITVLSDEQLKNYNLFVLGDPIETEYDQVKFIKPFPEKSLFEFLNDKHIFIDNFDYMPFSIMALEALSLGMIVIVPKESGISNYVTNAEDGFIFDSMNLREIKEILTDIKSGKFDLGKISNNAINLAKQLSWDNIAQTYLNFYKDVLSKN